MTSLTIQLPDNRFSAVKEKAAQLGVSPEELVQASIEDLLARPEKDFEQAMKTILKKNLKLYKRLA